MVFKIAIYKIAGITHGFSFPISSFCALFNCSRTTFAAIIVNVLVFFNANFSLDRFGASLGKPFLTSQVTFSRFRSSFLSDLYCSHSEIKLFDKLKSIAALKRQGTNSRVGSVSGEVSGGPWFEFRPG